MKINSIKTKTMLFNFTHNYQFRNRLKLKDETLQTVIGTKLLGTVLTRGQKSE